MIIKTITCHDVYNHGASLQAYALMKYLEQLGHDVEIINYKPHYLSNHHNLLSINNSKWEKSILTKIIYLLCKLPRRLIEFRRKRRFDHFTLNYLKLTAMRYQSNEELKKNPPYADAYICGSDQIWNTFYNNGKDPAFYLDFVPQDKLKISYAPSFAVEKLQSEYKDFVKEKVSSIDYISVREKSGVRILNNIGITSSEVLDPVFLLDKSEWLKLCKPIKYENYILVYDFDNNQKIKEISKKLAKENGYKIISISNSCCYADKNLWYVGPEIFISLVKKASFIISNSFHATAFAILFEKEFIVVNRKEGINSRITDLLSCLELCKRNSEFNFYNIVPIYYTEVNNKLKPIISKSELFIQNALRR